MPLKYGYTDCISAHCQLFSKSNQNFLKSTRGDKYFYFFAGLRALNTNYGGIVVTRKGHKKMDFQF